MRYRLMASYLGAPYQAAVGPSDRDVTLFAAPPPPEEHGFSPDPGGIWRKQVKLNEIDSLWESRPVGSYRGEPCLVLDDFGDRLHIVYLGMDSRRAAQLGYWQVDRGVFEVVVPRHEVTDLAEERHEFPLALLLSSLPRALSAGEQPAARPQPALQQRAAPPLPPQPQPPPPQPPPPPQAPLAPPPPQQPAIATAWHGSPVADSNGTWYRHQPPENGPPQNGAPQNGPQQNPGPRNGGSHNGNGDAPSPALQPVQALQPPRPAPSSQPPQPPALNPATTVNLTTAPNPALAPSQPTLNPAGASSPAPPSPAQPRSSGAVRGRRAARKPRLAMSAVFADLVDMADIPRSAYAVDEEVTGAMCLFKIDGGYEVFSCAEDARHEVRFFEDEEAAYFYLFGVLAADALRNDRLNPKRG
jgi:hypothetical protein